jgi:adenylyltransferase/sulfurtransferase
MPNQGCYRCVNPKPSTAESCRSCANAGVLGPVPGLIGCMQAIEVIKLAHLLCRTTIEDESYALKLAAPSRLKALVGRQIYVDATTSSFHEFELPRRNPDCAVCGNNPSILSMDDSDSALEGFSALSSALPAVPLPSENRITATEYADYLEQRRPHVLLDVRTTVQYGMINISDAVGGVGIPLNIPLMRLRGAQSAEALAELSAAIGAAGRQLQDRADGASSAGTGVDVFVLCRRGIDSVDATRYLLECSEQIVPAIAMAKFRNVQGGLNSWRSDVDKAFPEY